MEKENFNILLVDNDEMSLKSLSSFLVSEGYLVYSFSNPQEALDSFETHHYQFLLTDYSMPEMSGLQLIERVKTINPNIYTILYTGYATKLLDQQELSDQVDVFFKKPLRIRKLINILDNSINQHYLEEK